MKRIALLLVAAAAAAGAVASLVPGSGKADEKAVSVYLTEIPPGYRDWRRISVAREEATTATSPRRRTTEPLASPTNVQFMLEDSIKYASTGGWGFGHFQGGKGGDEAMM
ncbi:MAG TPA: hypothetical protein VFG59_14375 [Anaeromyxobacter sp.]|nr:hypothetical protein [Anaeromyxobacter sp.]